MQPDRPGEVAGAPEEVAEREVGLDRLRAAEPGRVGERLDRGVRVAGDHGADALEVRLGFVPAPPQPIPHQDRDHGERHRGDGDPGARHGAARAAAGVEPLPRGVEGLDHDALVGEDRHEVVVPRPARDDVPVQVIGDPCASGAAEVHPDVHPLRPVDPRTTSGPAELVLQIRPRVWRERGRARRRARAG